MKPKRKKRFPLFLSIFCSVLGVIYWIAWCRAKVSLDSNVYKHFNCNPWYRTEPRRDEFRIISKLLRLVVINRMGSWRDQKSWQRLQRLYSASARGSYYVMVKRGSTHLETKTSLKTTMLWLLSHVNYAERQTVTVQLCVSSFKWVLIKELKAFELCYFFTTWSNNWNWLNNNENTPRFPNLKLG